MLKNQKQKRSEGTVKITKRQLRRIIREAAKESEAGVFGSGMEQADLDKEKKELIGHT